MQNLSVDRIQTPADGHGEKEISCEGDISILAAAEPTGISNTNAQLQEILASVLQNVKQRVKEANEKLQMEIERSVKGEISKLKEEVRLENKRLIEQFERDNTSLSKCFDEKLNHECTKMGKLVQQVKDDNESELVAVKRDILTVSKELHNKIEPQVLKATEVTSELGNKLTLDKENAIEQVNEIKEAIQSVQTEMTKSAQTWQKEAGEKVQNLNIKFKKLESTNKGHFDQLNSEMNAMKLKLFACTTGGCSPTTLPPK
jgi:hypothetical protein